MGVISAANAARTKRRSQSRRAAWLLAGACGVLGAGCEVARPLDTFEGGVIPVRPEAAVGDFEGPGKEDFGPPSGMVVNTTGGAAPSVGGAATGGTPGTSGQTGGQPGETSGVASATTGDTGDTGGAPEEDPLTRFEGDYYFRLDERSVANGPPGLGRVTTTSVTLGQIRVSLEQGVLTGVERLCHITTNQQSDARELRTWMDDAVPGNITSIRRVFSVTDEGWSTDEVRRRMGWKEGPQGDVLPRDPDAQQSVIIDLEPEGVPGHGYPGLRVHGDVKVLVQDMSCAYDIVSFSDTAYSEGSFDEAGIFASASMDYGPSETYAFFGTPTTCDTSDVNNAPPVLSNSGKLQMRRLDQGIADFGACAPKSEFENALR